MRNGQVMLITVLAMSGTIIAATTISGILMLYQLRQATDVVGTTKAIFAADTGLEWRLDRFNNVDGQVCNADCEVERPSDVNSGDTNACVVTGTCINTCMPRPEMQENVSFKTSCEVKTCPDPSESSCDSAPPPQKVVVISSTGRAGYNARTFEYKLIQQ
ncbi:MAG: hypothetical protein HZB99_00970 [Candidatus Harrisonbacteria bacterium]|nr:hypothetical protein [Candidatus Harrisonbacteria bacterium]